MSDKLLEMKNISKYFHSVPALRNVSLSLDRAEILAIVGENGAGKSTLMKILSGSYARDQYEGEIYIGGVQKTFNSPIDAEKNGIEMIYQEISMHLDLSVAENIMLGRLPQKVGFVCKKEMNMLAREYMEMVGLNVLPKVRMRSLSTSQQQMVAIARALSRKPKILILDEPTSALTKKECSILMDHLRNLKEKGISCIYISHKLNEVCGLADKIVVLRDGETAAEFDNRGRDVDVDCVVHEMIGRKLQTMYPKKKIEVGEEVLRVENLTVAHPYTSNKNLVENINIHVRKGEIVALAGLVGAGRSEIVNAIFGEIKKESGDVFVEGKRVRIKSPKDAIRHGLGLLTEDRKKSGYIDKMDVKQNITVANLDLISKSIFLDKRKEKSIGREYIEKLNIKAQDASQNIMSLSGGNQQKVVIAKWLLKNLKVLILDEPTRGIDVGAKVHIYDIMNELASKGVGIIMISSELPELLAMGDRFYIIAGGMVRSEMAHGEISEDKFMKAATGL